MALASASATYIATPMLEPDYAEPQQLYSILNEKRKEIRLLYLRHSDDPDALIQCELFTVSLIEKPRFLALSYAWGGATVTENISVNNTAVAVTINLASALRHIQTVFGGVVIWVDAVCINQLDNQERSQQVQLMPIIYPEAVRVIAWLGTGDRESKVALDIMRRTSAAFAECEQDSMDWLTDFPELFPLVSKHGQIGQRWDEWEAIVEIFSRAYWRRLWIQQEFALARNIAIMCGQEILDPIEMTPLLSVIQRCGEDEVVPGVHQGLMMYFRVIETPSRWWKYPFSMMSLRSSVDTSLRRIVSLVEKTCNCGVTDPRDRIFALSGLSQNEIIPDYSRSTEEVYYQFASRWIEERGCVSILPQAELTAYGNRMIGRKRPTLPSWIPDWDDRPEVGTIASWEHLLAQYSASGSHSVDIWTSTNSKILWANGFYCDNVANIGPRVPRGFELLEDPSIALFFIGYWLSQAGKNYPTGISKSHAFFRLLLTDIDLLDGNRLDPLSSSYIELAAAFSLMIDLENAKRTYPSAYAPIELLDDLRDLGHQSFAQTNNTDISMRIANHIYNSIINRQIFLTERAYLGIGPLGMELGDVVCVLYGCNMPVILRQIDSHYFFIGLCFVLGLMDGEGIEWVQAGTTIEQIFEVH